MARPGDRGAAGCVRRADPVRAAGQPRHRGAIASDLRSISAGPSQRVGTAPLDRNVLEWLRAFSLETDLAGFEGQEADVIGFVYRDPALDGSARFLVARFVMSCCVADAQAIGLTVEWPGAADLQADPWVRVRGTFALRTLEGQPAPVLMAYAGADGVQPVDRPAHPYLYP
ncbi:MAG: TIGR03943 family protein [Sandaracinaceae bacterium]|nr:TIGR03943 family protein [Sandaracinaceae bacterium]